MTIIVALHDLVAGTWIGADSRATRAQSHIMPVVCRKWYRRGNVALAAAGDGKAQDLIEWAAPHGLLEPADALMVAAKLQAIVKADGWKGNAGERGVEDYGSSFILATLAGVWDIDGSFAVSRINDGEMWARGSGMSFALGAGHALCRDKRRREVYPEARIEAALNTAARFDAACGGPMFIEKLGSPAGG